MSVYVFESKAGLEFLTAVPLKYVDNCCQNPCCELRKPRPQLKKTISPIQYPCKVLAQYTWVQQQEHWKSSGLCFSYTSRWELSYLQRELNPVFSL